MKEETEERIDRFVENEMDPAERDIFCREMEADTTLKEQVALRMLLVEAELMEAEQTALKAMQGRKTVSLPVIKRVGGFVAAAALLAGAVFFIGNGHRYTSDEIYRTYFSEPAIEPSRGGSVADMADILTNKQLVELYKQKKYSEVAVLYNQHWSKRDWNELPVTSLLYVSVSLLRCDRAAEAIPLLSSSRLLSSPYSEEAEWLLLFAYLQEGEQEKAIVLAGRIEAGGGIFAGKAAEIYNKLEEKRWF